MQTQNWSKDFKDAFRDLKNLQNFLNFETLSQLEDVENVYPIFIPLNLAKKIKSQGPDGVLAKEFLPCREELSITAGSIDPIGDKRFNQAPQLIHRYPSRALFAPTTVCPVHCRYCFRKNELYQNEEIFKAEFSETLSYLKNHPEITEIIFTGGDPFTLSNEKVSFYLESFKKIESIRDIRFHTRYPVVLPSRIDEELCNLLDNATTHFRTVTVAIHANHLTEFDEESDKAIKGLASTKIQLLSQTVLLKGVNNNVEALLNLFNHFLELRIRPYYLHHPDQVKGGLHFYLSLEEGRSLYQKLRPHLPGWAIPTYILDLPGGDGKVLAHNPEGKFSGEFLALNGEIVSYQAP